MILLFSVSLGGAFAACEMQKAERPKSDTKFHREGNTEYPVYTFQPDDVCVDSGGAETKCVDDGVKDFAATGWTYNSDYSKCTGIHSWTNQFNAKATMACTSGGD
jgi:hypothetical protein